MSRKRRKPEPKASVVEWRRHVWPVVALWVLALAAYSNSFRAGFALDSGTIILGDTRVHAATAENLHLIWTQEYWYNTATTGAYRPLTTFTYLVNYAVLGNEERPAGYHWVNFAVHAGNIALVYCLGLLLFRERTAALALAGLWAVHPVLTEAVTNLVGRADLLAGLGILGALLCHVQSFSAAGRHRPIWLAGVAVFAAVASFSKESGVVVIAAMVLYDVALGRATWRARLAGYVAAGIPVLAFLYMRAEVLSALPVGQFPFGDNPLLGADFLTAQMTAVKVIGEYLYLLLWPARLSSDYSYNQVPLFTGNDWRAFAALGACMAIAGAAVYAWRRNRTVFFLIVLFFVMLAPVSNVFVRIGTIMAERFLYLPAIAFLGCVVWAARRIPQRRAVHAAVALVALMFAARTWSRNQDWYDDLAIWESAGRAAPDSFKVHTMLADLWLQKPDGLNRAVTEIDRALAIIDPLPEARNTVRPYAVAGAVYLRKGDAAGDRQWYERARAALERGARVDRATLTAVRRANEANGREVLASGWAPVYLELGRVRLRLGEPRRALEALDYGRGIRPDTEFFEEMSAAWRALGDPREAAIALMEAFALDPRQTQLAAELAELYRQTAPGSCAIRASGAGSTLDLACPLVHDEVCAASRNVVALHQRRGRADLAAGTRLNAIRNLGCPAGIFP